MILMLPFTLFEPELSSRFHVINRIFQIRMFLSAAEWTERYTSHGYRVVFGPFHYFTNTIDVLAVSVGHNIREKAHALAAQDSATRDIEITVGIAPHDVKIIQTYTDNETSA